LAAREPRRSCVSTAATRVISTEGRQFTSVTSNSTSPKGGELVVPLDVTPETLGVTENV
jgi:hypothetical protein